MILMEPTTPLKWSFVVPRERHGEKHAATCRNLIANNEWISRSLLWSRKGYYLWTRLSELWQENFYISAAWEMETCAREPNCGPKSSR